MEEISYSGNMLLNFTMLFVQGLSIITQLIKEVDQVFKKTMIHHTNNISTS